VEPRDAATAAVVWLHGLGADGHDFAPIVPVLRLPHARFVFPHAPAMPVTINGGFVMPAWYDIRSLDRAPDREDAEDIRVSAECIAELLEREIDRGIPAERIVLAGFSQGAAMALHVGLRFPERLAGIVVLSGYLVLPETLAAEWHAENRSTPVLFGHGRHDDLVPMASGREAFDRVQRHRPPAHTSWHEFPIGHEVDDAEIDVVARWLKAQLP
jgi:phospholipase/carboxylesterase